MPMARVKKPTSSSADEMSFEQAVEELQAIIDRIEQGRVGLEDSLAQWKRGQALIKRCRAILDVAEQEVKQLSAASLDDAADDDEQRDDDEREDQRDDDE